MKNKYGRYVNLFSNKYLVLPLVIFLLLASHSSKSIALSNSLYEAMVPVSQTLPNKSQSELVGEGLKLVLIQLSGAEKTVQSPVVKRALESADSYVARFSYKEDAEKKRFLRVKFDENRVNELLRRINAPILAQDRPSTTVWLVVSHEQDKHQWVSAESETELFQQLNADAKLRAIPLLFPLLDLTDTEQVSEKTVWDDNFTVLQTASKRYNADVLWIGKLSQQKSGWHGQWTLIANGKAQTWDNSNEKLDQLCKDAMDELSKRLGRALHVYEEPLNLEDPYHIPEPNMINPSVGSPEHFNRHRPQVSRFRLSVAGVKDMDQYTKLQTYLKNLPEVQEVEVTLVTANETLFDVAALCDRQAFIDAIAAGKVLLDNTPTEMETSAQQGAWVNAESTATTEDALTSAQKAAKAASDSGILSYRITGAL